MITEQQKELILGRINIVDLINNRIGLRKTGKNWSGLCPFHNEKTPSFSVNEEKQFYYCFGCGASGDAISFLMYFERISFPQAVKNIAAMLGVILDENQKPINHLTRQQKALIDYKKTLEIAMAIYRQKIASGEVPTDAEKKEAYEINELIMKIDGDLCKN